MQTLQDLGGWPAILGPLCAGQDLSGALATAAMTEVLTGAATPAQIAGFAVALRMKGETVEEMSALVDAMFALSDIVPLDAATAAVVIDTCGTGGDRSGSVNVSTMAAIVATGAGARVCKHGGRAASSEAGSADVLEALGVTLDVSPAGVARCVEKVGMGFCFAPQFHPAMRHARPVRSDLGVSTVFNILGPLANPARVRRQVLGVSDPCMAEKMLGVLRAHGSEHALVVYGHDGLDELSTIDVSTILELRDDEIRSTTVDPRALGFSVASRDELRGGDAAHNAARVLAILGGERGPQRDVVLLNAAAALVVAGIVPALPEGIAASEESIDSGSASKVLDGLVRVSSEAAVA